MYWWHFLRGREYILPFLADVTNWTSVLQNQAPVVVLVTLAFAAGYKKIWRYGHQYDEMKTGKEEEIARLIREIAEIKVERDKRIEDGRRDTDMEISRVKDERERERARAQRYEDMAIRSLETNRDIVKVVADALEKRRP